ncbi:7451_t:CDS:2 [Ambispora leptoticha]|uniref:7451_t:CDS:1 n=1 Tax=Ambispora leptoticha TaxID=144679 RepID=A0A9N9C351_9GLOM|nr:7451_t:CDS:2 [Ambispora leptoticha]
MSQKMKVNSTNKKTLVSLKVKLPFPPEITPLNLIEKSITKLKVSGKTSRVPNSFICYRMTFCKVLQSLRYPVITQPQLSTMIKESWLGEPEHVRMEYQRISSEASNIYKQMCIDHKLLVQEQKNKFKNVPEGSPIIISTDNSSGSSSSSSSETRNLDNLFPIFHSQTLAESESLLMDTEPSPHSHLNIYEPDEEVYSQNHLQNIPNNTRPNVQSMGISPSFPAGFVDPSLLNYNPNAFNKFPSLSSSCEGCNEKIEALTQRGIDGYGTLFKPINS